MAFSRRGDMNRVQQELEAEAQRDHHINRLLPRAIEAAHELGAPTIICFSFGRLDHTEGDLASEEVVQVMRFAADKVAAAGLTLAIEVAELTQRSADICRRVNNPALGINWDPGNAFIGGEDQPFPLALRSPGRTSDTCTSRMARSIRSPANAPGLWTAPSTGMRRSRR